MGIKVADPHKLHITLIFSRVPVNWRDPVFLEDPSLLWLTPQCMRVIRFGHDDEILALEVKSPTLEARHAALRAAGAGWDHSSYRPHITLGSTPAHELPKAVTFTGVIELGPEVRKRLIL